MKKKTFKDIDVAGKRVFVRVDFNVPQDDAGKITDDTRIRAALPTIKYLVNQKARVILCSHLGRPKGVVNEKYSLKPVSERLSELLNVPVAMAEDVVGASAKKLTSEMKDGEVVFKFEERLSCTGPRPQEDLDNFRKMVEYWARLRDRLEDGEITESEYYFKEVKFPMNPTDPDKGYTVSLNLDDDDQLMVQNMNEDEEAEETADEEIPEEDVDTVKDFAKSLDEYDGKLKLEFKPIVIDGKEYPVTGIMWDDSEEGKLVAEVVFDASEEDTVEDEGEAEDSEIEFAEEPVEVLPEDEE